MTILNPQTKLKSGDSFVVFDQTGELPSSGGLFHCDTRYLSCLQLRINGLSARVLSLSQPAKNLVIHLASGPLHLQREIKMTDFSLDERLTVSYYGLEPFSLELELSFEADFADIFEVRGISRPQHGQTLDTILTTDTVSLVYQSLDHQIYTTRLGFTPEPKSLNAQAAVFKQQLNPQDSLQLRWKIDMLSPERAPAAMQVQKEVVPELQTEDQSLKRWIDQSRQDLHLLLSQTEHGLYPYAGLPWYSTVFGRDGIITALQCLNLAPEIARGVLQVLAATQATSTDPSRDAEPGKILHESRQGEMARLAEIPYGQYYGSVDATPLFILLAGEYWRQTGDLELIQNIWPQLQFALHWIETNGDRDGDGFVEYFKLAPGELVHQGWKDSGNAVFHADGRPAEGSIALCEVQAYVYGARLAIAELAEQLGDSGLAQQQHEQAKELQQRFEAQFWCEELGAYGLALDGDKQLCRVLSSNAGQVLFTGIASSERAQRVAQAMLSPAMFSGWGICTLSTDSQSFNPMSYHNGSIWPHDNAMIAAGFARYGLKTEAQHVFQALFELSQQSGYRLPELICGFKRREGEAPVPYPVACSPQAWAAGAVYQLIQAAGIPVSKIN